MKSDLRIYRRGACFYRFGITRVHYCDALKRGTWP